ncbi:MAG: hypothetical protein HKM93_16065 [Desulfobacteraceae bacterium]|nr:hypothetical protein [Desulfobacteraceae bacterium]
METYTLPKELVENPDYGVQRRKIMAGLSDGMIDGPIIDIVNGVNRLPHCFTLQSCYGHFLYSGQNDPFNTDPLPVTGVTSRIQYKIAYIALCIEYNASGKRLMADLQDIAAVDTANIQFCCAEWFWKRQVNSYALQVEPDRYKCEDTATLDYAEAVHIESVRNEVYDRLKDLLG